MIITHDYRDTKTQALAFGEAVHVEFWASGGIAFENKGYISITPEQARNLGAELLAAAAKAEKYAEVAHDPPHPTAPPPSLSASSNSRI